MLSAINWYGEVLAMDIDRDDGPFYCPACHDAVILKKAEKRFLILRIDQIQRVTITTLAKVRSIAERD